MFEHQYKGEIASVIPLVSIVMFVMIIGLSVYLTKNIDFIWFYLGWIMSFLVALYCEKNHFGLDFVTHGVEAVFTQFNILDIKDGNSFTFVVKITLSFLYYQFITAVRKDTRK